MKQKIKEALQQGHKNLGLSDEVFERVAASVETFITDEADIDKYVKSELVNSLLKFEQADADRKRAKREGEKKEPDNGNQPPEPNPEPKPQDTPDIAALIEAALDKKLHPITERLNNFETAQSQKSAIAALDELKATWDYAQGFPEESEYAYNMAMGIYNGIGKTWTAEQLTAKYKETFNERVSKKGFDTTKPFPSDGASGGEAELDMAEVMKIYQKSGRVQGKE